MTNFFLFLNEVCISWFEVQSYESNGNSGFRNILFLVNWAVYVGSHQKIISGLICSKMYLAFLEKIDFQSSLKWKIDLEIPHYRNWHLLLKHKTFYELILFFRRICYTENWQIKNSTKNFLEPFQWSMNFMCSRIAKFFIMKCDLIFKWKDRVINYLTSACSNSIQIKET